MTPFVADGHIFNTQLFGHGVQFCLRHRKAYSFGTSCSSCVYPKAG